jgi:hypothetical protein
MRERLFSEQTNHFSEHISNENLIEEMSPRPQHRWLAILWIFSSIIAMVGWWSGLAWTAAWVVERAFS